MSGQFTHPRNATRVSLAWLLAAVLLFAQAFAGRGVVLHTHGDGGAHVHVTPDAAMPAPELEWHAALHADEHDAHASDGDDPAAASQPSHEHGAQILVGVPASEIVPAGASVPAGAFGLHAPLPACGPLATLPVVRPPAPPSPEIPARPQNHGERSGVARLLRSSRALLI